METPPRNRVAAKRTASGAFGQRLGQLFHIESAPAFVATGLRAGKLAVTDIRSDDPVLGVTDTVPEEDAYLLCLLEREMRQHQIWEDGHPLAPRTVRVGEFLLRDLKRGQAALIDRPHHSMHFYIPRSALNEIADDAGAPRIGELSHTPGVPICDPIALHLAACFRPALANPDQANRLFLEHALLALGIHVAATYGGMTQRVQPPNGGLARWQERRAQEMLRADLRGDTSLADIARECGLSVSQFSRAFKKSTGSAPHRWLIQQRVEVAKTRLADPAQSLASIALSCGFADQSHLTRVFSRYTGATPAAWRRSL